MTHRLRRATAEDAAAIAATHAISRRHAYAGLNTQEPSATERTQFWHGILSQPENAAQAVYLVEEAGLALGFAACGRQRDAALAAQGFPGEIHALYVLPDRQGQGIGRALLGACARRLLAHGMAGMALWVLHANTAARSFYLDMGAAEIANRENAQGLMQVAVGWRSIVAMAAQ